MADATKVIEPVLSASSSARRWTDGLLERWGLGACRDEALLVVSELVTNAVMHGRGPIELRLTRRAGGLRIAVSDADPSPVSAVDRGIEDPTGRGLRIVAAIAGRWGHQTGPDGKTVWADVGP